MIGQLQLCERLFANGVMVFNDHFFSDDTHVEEVTIENFFAVTGAGIQLHGRRDSLPTLFHRPFVARHHRLHLPESRYVEYVQCSSRFVDKYPVHADFCRRSRPPAPGLLTRPQRWHYNVNKPYGWHQCPGHVRGRSGLVLVCKS